MKQQQQNETFVSLSSTSSASSSASSAVKLLTTLGLLSVMLACERVVNVDLQEGPKRLVIEARLERVLGQVKGQQRIRLTTTQPYFSTTAPPPARGAVVRVTDGTGQVRQFTELPTEPGTYVTSALVGVVGMRYTLTIDFEGERYEATDQMQAVVPIDSLYFDVPTGFFGPEEKLRATIDFRDPAGVKNYYLWDQFNDGVRLPTPDSTFKIRVVASDDVIDGQEITGFQPYGGIVVEPGQVVVVRQVALSEQSYRYYFALSDQTSNDGSPFSVSAASVRGNVANLTRPSHFPLGYFIAAEVAEAQATVPRK
jgi:hypothetical protein